MQVYINNNQSKINTNIEYWEDFLLKVGDLLEIEEETELSVTFVDNEEIHELNKTYRDIDRPTDVLSFPFDNSFNLPVSILGDVIVSLERAKEQSEEYKHSLKREISFLLVHGILHLLGYDHKTPEDEKEMFDLQKDLLTNFTFKMARIRAENLLDSFKYALQGIVYTIKTQRNMRLHLVAGTLVFLAGFFLKVSTLELAILVVVTTMVIVAEMFNTAIESTVDLYTRQRHPLAKLAKDVAAAAVLMCAISSVIVGLLILGPPFFDFLSEYLLKYGI